MTESKSKSRRVLVIAAHPDDELLGCGGTVALHAKQGDRVRSIVVCEGTSLRNITKPDAYRSQAQNAANILGVENIATLDFPDQRLDTITFTDIISPLEKSISEFQPHLIYCQYGGDINLDHELLFKAAMVAFRPTVPCIEAVYAFDTASSTEWAFPRSFVPDTWVDISETINAKLKAMACYESELRGYPHPRSLQGLKNKAEAWGNQACMDFAEVFMTVRRSYRNGKTPF
jgi:LmbE family N-acetylglucosaminyl deacetylase